MHKHKNNTPSNSRSSNKTNLKRHYSLNEVQGISPSTNNETSASKRRNSSDINIVDPFSNTNLKNATLLQQCNSINQQQQANRLKTSPLDVSVIDEFLSSSTSPIPIENSIDLTKTANNLNPPQRKMLGVGNTNATGVNLCHSLNDLISAGSHLVNTPTVVTLNHTGQNVSSVFTTHQNVNTKLIPVAPNITITQGMTVSLPNAATVLRTNIVRSNTESQTINSTAPNITLKQVKTFSNFCIKFIDHR